MCAVKGICFNIPYSELNKLKIDYILTDKQLKEKQKKLKEGKGINLTLTTAQMKKIKNYPKEHIGGFIFSIPAILAALGSLAGGAAAIAKTVLDEKKNREEIEELKRHNKVIEGGKIRKSKNLKTSKSKKTNH
jgi:peroxiredoxin